jgi:hypothetical protein
VRKRKKNKDKEKKKEKEKKPTWKVIFAKVHSLFLCN